MKNDIYTVKGAKAGSIDLPEAVFAQNWNAPFMYQVLTAMQANARTPVAHAKNRGDVSGGGKKPWQQKGTGRSRHGSIRSPLWKGGGVTHGPLKDRDYSQKINKKSRAKALAIALSQKLRDGQIIFVDSVVFASPKAADAKALLTGLGSIAGFEALTTRRNNAALLALSARDTNTQKSFNNFGNVEVDEVRNLNPVDVLKYKYLIIANPTESVATLSARMDGKTSVRTMKTEVVTEKPVKKAAAKKTAAKKTTK